MKYEEKNGKNDSKNNAMKKTGLFVCLWILVFLVIFMIFLIKRDVIKENFQKTNFFEKASGKTPTTAVEKKEESPAKNESSGVFIDLNQLKQSESSKENPPDEKPAEQIPAEEEKTEVLKKIPNSTLEAQPEEEINQFLSDIKEMSNSTATSTFQEEEAPVQKATGFSAAAKLYFLKVDVNGSVSRYEVTRSILKNDSPLTTNINLLIEGPNPAEEVAGCQSLLPKNTKLLSATVKDRVAYLDFNEEFEFNTVGVEGLLAQLMQVVYTATEFSTVDSVQILINGQKQNYLGLEGVWVGSPLTRASFK